MSISLPLELARLVRQSAKAEGMTISAWVARAVARQAKFDLAHRLQHAYEAEHGPFTDEEIARAEAVWPEG